MHPTCLNGISLSNSLSDRRENLMQRNQKPLIHTHILGIPMEEKQEAIPESKRAITCLLKEAFKAWRKKVKGEPFGTKLIPNKWEVHCRAAEAKWQERKIWFTVSTNFQIYFIIFKQLKCEKVSTYVPQLMKILLLIISFY